MKMKMKMKTFCFALLICLMRIVVEGIYLYVREINISTLVMRVECHSPSLCLFLLKETKPCTLKWTM